MNTHSIHSILSVLSVIFPLFPFFPLSAFAQSPVITRATSLAIGHTRQQDTYLSPLDFSGTQLSYLKESQRPVTLWHTPLQRQSLFQLNLSTTESPAGNSDYLGGLLRYDATWFSTLCSARSDAPRLENPQPSALNLSLGPQLGGTLGTLYHTRNGNNPAQLIAEAHLAVSAQAALPFRLWKRHFVLRDQMDIPLLGAMFSPNYGQSYYELFSLGHTDHNVCITHPFNAPSLRNRLTLDFRIGRQTFRAGYLLDVRQSHVNDLRRHDITHAFLIGWVRQITFIH